jgi:hypothetical protein
MKPYYKKGGFFDRLERLSDWIDDEIDMAVDYLRWYGIMYFVPGFRRLTFLSKWLDINRRDIEKHRREYNKIKYWWMKEL